VVTVEVMDAWYPFPAADDFIAKFINAMPALAITIIVGAVFYKFFKALLNR